jgi:hypothetical protein
MQVGWASADVTPLRPVILRGQFHVRVSERVNDPLTATALALEGQDAEGRPAQAIMMSCDHVGISRDLQDGLRERVRARLRGFHAANLFVCCTHTHTAPEVAEGNYPRQGPEVMTPTECAAFLVERMADAAVQAWENRRPGGVAWAFGQAVVGHNRRAVYNDGTARMYGNTDDPRFECIEGYEDHSLNALFLWDERRRLTGVVVNLACPSQVTENACYVSADFWHEVRAEVRRRHGSDLFILPQCAPAGDQSPHFLIYKKEEAYMRERLGLTEREVIGCKIADAVAELLAAPGEVHGDPVFQHVVKTIELPLRRITEDDVAKARAEAERLEALQPTSEPDVSRTFMLLRRCRNVTRRYDEQKVQAHYPMELHVIRLGDVAIATNAFELFLDFGIRIKARSEALQTFLVQLACDYKGYLPTARAVAAGSYGAEAASNHVGPEGGQVLVDKTVEEIARLWREGDRAV